MESIFHLRHHPKSGFLQYRRVVPQKLRPIVGNGTIIRITGGNFCLVHRLLAQVERMLRVNTVSDVTSAVVDAAREGLVIGAA